MSFYTLFRPTLLNEQTRHTHIGHYNTLLLIARHTYALRTAVRRPTGVTYDLGYLQLQSTARPMQRKQAACGLLIPMCTLPAGSAGLTFADCSVPGYLIMGLQ